jgi:hypothetical protein
MCEKRIAMLKKSACKPARPVQSVQPEPAVPLQPNSGAPNLLRSRKNSAQRVSDSLINLIGEFEVGIAISVRNCVTILCSFGFLFVWCCNVFKKQTCYVILCNLSSKDEVKNNEKKFLKMHCVVPLFPFWDSHFSSNVCVFPGEKGNINILWQIYSVIKFFDIPVNFIFGFSKFCEH